MIRILLNALAGIMIFTSAYAAVDLELTQGVRRAVPIAVVAFSGQEGVVDAQNLEKVIAADLVNSGRFRPVEGEGQGLDVDVAYWRNQGANYVIAGQVLPGEQGKNLVTVRLLDPAGREAVLLNRQFQAEPTQMRRLGHQISDIVYEMLTGDKGIFSTRIAYVNAQHDVDKFILEVADFDGFNPRPLLTSSQPIMSPAWSPDGRQIAYVTFQNKQAEIHTVDIASGQRQMMTDYPGINGAPAWSPDGKKLAVVLSKDGAPSIYEVDVASKQLTRLTHGSAIDTEPQWTPDGSAIIFTSDRGGSPQIYRLSLADNNIERLTFRGNYNAHAAYTPDSRDLVMLHLSKDGRFNIAAQDIQSGFVNVLTKTGNNESPSIAPSGKMIIYASQFNNQGTLNITSLDGQVHIRLPAQTGDVQEPAWSPFH